MYLNVFKMDRKSILNATKLLDLSNSNSVHQFLCGRMNSHRKDAKILYRTIEKDDALYLYVQSKDKFDHEKIENRGLVFLKELHIDSLTDNGIYDFDIKCFPNVCKNQSYYFLKNQEERYAWLQKQFNKHGLKITNCTEYNLSDVYIGNHNLKYMNSATYRGTLQVTDPIQAFDFIENGLGRYKNYGFGMLLIR